MTRSVILVICCLFYSLVVPPSCFLQYINNDNLSVSRPPTYFFMPSPWHNVHRSPYMLACLAVMRIITARLFSPIIISSSRRFPAYLIGLSFRSDAGLHPTLRCVPGCDRLEVWASVIYSFQDGQ